MRLSEIKGDRCLDVIADIIEPIAKMAEDDAVVELFKPKAVPDGMDQRGYFVQRMRAGVPALLKGHKAEIIAIMAAIEGVAPKKYARDLTFGKLIHDVFDVLTDEAILSFLPSQPTTSTASGDASATIVDLNNAARS